MKVLLVVEPGVDGAFRHVEGLAHFLLDQGQHVHLAYSDRRGSPQLHQLVEFVKQQGGQCLNLHVDNAPELADLTALLRLRRLARQVKPDIIHGHSSKAGVLTRTLKFTGIHGCYFYTPHAYYGLTPRPGLKSRLFNRAERVLGRVGTTINISPDETRFAQQALKVPLQNIRTIHNPVATEVFLPADASRRSERRSELGLPQDAVLLGSIGRLSYQKDPETMYRALAPLLRQEPALYLFQVGQGEMDPVLQQLALDLGIADKVIRHCYLEIPLTFYQAIDALIVTSRYEAGWPLVVLEALSCNLPVIVSQAPGTMDIAEAGLSHCWTARPGDVTAFTQAVEAWLNDRQASRQCNHRELAAERFSVQKCFGAVLDAYLQCFQAEARESDTAAPGTG